MHELAITRSLIESIKEECKTHGIKKPKKIVLELGKLTSYVGDTVQLYFDNLKHEEPKLQNTKLEITEVPGTVECNDCRKTGEVKDCCLIMCPVCDSLNVDVSSGKDIIIKSIEK